MGKKDWKRLITGIGVLVFFNFMLIFNCVKDGMDKGDLMLRFRERQTVTLVSGLFLGFTALTSLFIFFLKKKAGLKAERYLFWLLSAAGFLFLCLDEYFMVHEGIDNWVGSWFGQDVTHLNLDNLVLAFYGFIALGVCYYFRIALWNHKVMWLCLAVGALGLGGTVLFHGMEKIDMVYEVTEESFKIIGVTFFFLAYYLALLTSLDRVMIISKDQPHLS